MVFLNTFLRPPPRPPDSFSDRFRIVSDRFQTVSDRFRPVFDDCAGEKQIRAKNLRAEGPQILCESVCDDRARTNERIIGNLQFIR